jgi:hypothetical protein
MPLMTSSLAHALASLFESEPTSAVEAGQRWAQAYVSYASAAQSPTGGVPANATAGLSVLGSAFTSALGTQDAAGAAGAMSAGVMAFWQMMVWTGAAAVGVTAAPGNFALTSALTSIFGDTGEVAARDKVDQLADAFDAGAKMVIVVDTPLVQPAPPVVGPIQ